MVEIDGSEGGGQILRTALSLSMVTGRSVELTGIRGDRPEPGLGHQHLAAVETAARVCDATVDGAGLGATEIAFDPREPTGGDYETAIGTAGSIALLFDTFLPVATRIEEPLWLTATGGTDVAWSPPMAFYRCVKLPLLRGVGLAAVVDHGRTGFYPAGGGEATLALWPSSPSSLALADPARKSADVDARVYSTAAQSLGDADVAERQADAAEDELAELDVPVTARQVTEVETDSPGSVVVVHLDGDGVTAGFDAYGEPGKPAEDVAADAIDGVRRFRDGGAAVDAHLADQLLFVLAMAGGRLAIPRVTGHVASSLDVFAAFGFELALDESGRTPVVHG